MKNYLILILILFLAIMEGSFLRLDLVLLVVLTWEFFKLEVSLKGTLRLILLVAFTAGLLLDLMKGLTLGLSSFLFLLFSFFLWLYAQRLDPWKFFFFPIFVSLCEGIYQMITRGFMDWLRIGLLVILALFFRFAAGFFGSGVDRKEIKLKI